MINESLKKLCLFHILDGMSEGFSHYSGPSRAAVIYAEKPDDPIRVYDPQNLLQGHEPRLKELYLESDRWRVEGPDTQDMMLFEQIYPEKNLQMAGLISYGGRTRSIFYQMWFTEHHPDMCSIGPTERWLEHAAFLLSHDFATEDAYYTGSSRYVLREYATHAVRDYILDELNIMLGWDARIRVYPILDAVLYISKTLEEGEWPNGKLTFIEPESLMEQDFMVMFPVLERPRLKNFKHVRKLLLAVENSDRCLVSDWENVVGIAGGKLPETRITADFKGRTGFLRLAGNPVCSFFDGRFHSSTHRPNLVQLEETLLETKLDPSLSNVLYNIVTSIVHEAGKQLHGCTIVIDLNDPPTKISGQDLEKPLDLQKEEFLGLAKSLAKVDGALHIGADLHLHGFANLLDGRAVPGEDRARGARFNSALRFTAEHDNIIVVVVSSDRPVSVMQGGVELTAQCEWKPFSEFVTPVPKLEDWLNQQG